MELCGLDPLRAVSQSHQSLSHPTDVQLFVGELKILPPNLWTTTVNNQDSYLFHIPMKSISSKFCLSIVVYWCSFYEKNKMQHILAVCSVVLNGYIRDFPLDKTSPFPIRVELWNKSTKPPEILYNNDSTFIGQSIWSTIAEILWNILTLLKSILQVLL